MTKRTCKCKIGRDCDKPHEVDWFGAKFAASPVEVVKTKEIETQTKQVMLKRSRSTQTMLYVRN